MLLLSCSRVKESKNRVSDNNKSLVRESILSELQLGQKYSPVSFEYFGNDFLKRQDSIKFLLSTIKVNEVNFLNSYKKFLNKTNFEEDIENIDHFFDEIKLILSSDTVLNYSQELEAYNLALMNTIKFAENFDINLLFKDDYEELSKLAKAVNDQIFRLTQKIDNYGIDDVFSLSKNRTFVYHIYIVYTNNKADTLTQVFEIKAGRAVGNSQK